VILAVCSKNTEAIAKEAFASHAGMALRLEDISCFMANWDDKASNLGTIAKTLNIGLNSIVFVDDNPVERSIARQLQPEVSVPEMPDDPAYFVQTIDRLKYFEAPSISSEDLARTDFYQADRIRQAAASTSADLDKFLQSLELTATIRPIDRLSLDRCVQLINRSNQFNVTTRRHTAADVMAMIDDPSWLSCAVSLKDRFGDNGLISVVLAKVDADHASLVIDSWLMSCRVLKRGVEHALLNHLADAARSRHLSQIIGEYIPTPKNGLVKDLFESLGFTLQLETDDHRTRWSYPVNDSRQPLSHFIAVS
jgi:FkbH-like protein